MRPCVAAFHFPRPEIPLRLTLWLDIVSVPFYSSVGYQIMHNACYYCCCHCTCCFWCPERDREALAGVKSK